MKEFWPTELVDVVAIITGVFVMVGGVMGIRQYLKSLRLEGAKILLVMERSSEA